MSQNLNEEYDSIKKNLESKENNSNQNIENQTETENEFDLNPRRIQSNSLINKYKLSLLTNNSNSNSNSNRKQKSDYSSMTTLPFSSLNHQSNLKQQIKNEEIQEKEYYKRYSHLYNNEDQSKTIKNKENLTPVVKKIQSNIEGIKSKLQNYETIYDSINSKMKEEDNKDKKRLLLLLEEKEKEIRKLNREVKMKDEKIIELENEILIFKSDTERKVIRVDQQKTIVDYKKKYIQEMEALQKTFEDFKKKAVLDYSEMKQEKNELEVVIERMKYENELNQSSIKEAESLFRSKAENIRQLIKANEILKIENEKFKNEIFYLNHQIKCLSQSEKRLQGIILENEYINDKLNDFGIEVGIERQGKIYENHDFRVRNEDDSNKRSFSPLIHQQNITTVSECYYENNSNSNHNKKKDKKDKSYVLDNSNTNSNGNNILTNGKSSKQLAYSNSNIYKINNNDKKDKNNRLLYSNLSSKIQPQFDSDTDERHERQVNYSHNYNNSNNNPHQSNYLLYNTSLSNINPHLLGLNNVSNQEIYKKTKSKDKNLLFKSQLINEYEKSKKDNKNINNRLQTNLNIYSHELMTDNNSSCMLEAGSCKGFINKDVNQSLMNSSLKHSQSNKFPVAKQSENRREHLAEMPLQRHMTYKK